MRASGKKGHDNNNEGQEITIGEILEAMEGPCYPEHIKRLLAQLQDWLCVAARGEQSPMSEEHYWGKEEEGPEGLLASVSWVQQYADMIPCIDDNAGSSDAVVLAVGPIYFDEGLRMALDQAAIFGRSHCKRVWLLTDNWQMGDIAAYMNHIGALLQQGVEIRFILITPWGWTEIPVARHKRANLNWN